MKTRLDPRKARRVTAPLPHPSWRHVDPAAAKERRKPISADEFWDRLGI